MSDSELYGQDSDLQLVAFLRPHLTGQFFIDIGAERGSFAAALLNLGLEGACFDPLPAHYKHLQTRFAGAPLRIFPLAVDASDHAAEFHVATGADGQDLDYFHSLNPIGKHDFFQHTKVIPVECRSLASLVEQGELPEGIGVLKVDTEGNDLRVLQGLGEVRPEVVICEFVPPVVYPQWELAFAANLVPAAAALGYANFVAVRRVHGTPGESLDLNPTDLGANDWGNLVFFRADFWAKVEAPLKEFLQNWVPPAIESAPAEEPPTVSATPAVENSSPTSAATVPTSWWEKLLGRK
jgi:FkbM family methyltransferase